MLENADCPVDPPPEILFDKMKISILHTSEEVLRFSIRKKKDRFDENNLEIQELMKKRSAH